MESKVAVALPTTQINQPWNIKILIQSKKKKKREGIRDKMKLSKIVEQILHNAWWEMNDFHDHLKLKYESGGEKLSTTGTIFLPKYYDLQQPQKQPTVEAPPQPSLEELVRQMTIQNMQFQQEIRASIS